MTAKIDNNKFLLKTECTFLVDNFIEKLKREYKSHTFEMCNSPDKFIESATSSSIFNEGSRLLVLKDLDPDFLDAVSSIINGDTDDVWVIIQKQKISRTKAYTVIKGACQYVELKELSESQCAVWVRQWLTEIKLIFSEEIPIYIVSRVGTDISKLHNEIKKVAAYYTGSDKRILTQLDCNEFFSEDAETRFFVIIESFFRKRVREVFEELKRVDDYSLVKLLHMLIGQTEKLYKVAIYREQKMSPEDIGEMISIPKFIVTTKFFSYLSFYNKTKLIMLLDLFNELDVEMRQTKLPKSLVFESYILKAMKK
jgi:DNA polymerase III delta subunit